MAAPSPIRAPRLSFNETVNSPLQRRPIAIETKLPSIDRVAQPGPKRSPLVELAQSAGDHLRSTLEDAMTSTEGVLESGRPRLSDGERTGLAAASHLTRKALAIAAHLELAGRISQWNVRTVVDTAQLTNEIVAGMSDVLRDTGAEIEIGALPELFTLRPALEFIMKELLANAINYRSADPAHVTVQAWRVESTWNISVDDNGIGVPSIHRDQIFEPFFTVDPRSWRPGLGLAVCRLAAEQLGGNLRVEESTRGGCLFRLSLADSAVR